MVNLDDFRVKKATPGGSPAVKKTAVSNPVVMSATDENWDDDDSTLSYDPISTLEGRDVIRVDKKLLARAERKQFLEEERLRLNDIRNNKKN